MAETTGNFKRFWTSSLQGDPKRGFRFKVEFGTLGMLWFAKKASRPKLSFTEASHQFLNHTYYWPARAEWDEVTITLVDPVEPDVAGTLLQFLEKSGYHIPGSPQQGGASMSSPSKKGAVDATGLVSISVISESDAQLEHWRLNNAWIKSVDFSEMDYSNDDLSEVTVTLRYDWADFQGKGVPAINAFQK